MQLLDGLLCQSLSDRERRERGDELKAQQQRQKRRVRDRPLSEHEALLGEAALQELRSLQERLHGSTEEDESEERREVLLVDVVVKEARLSAESGIGWEEPGGREYVSEELKDDERLGDGDRVGRRYLSGFELSPTVDKVRHLDREM